MADDLIHEIEESIKQEKLEKFWKEYGPYLIAAIVLAVLFTALVSGWRGWNDKINASQTSAVIQALAEEDQVAAIDKIAAELRPNQRAVAQLTTAGLLARDEKMEQALAHYNAAATDKDIKPVFRDLALLMAARTEWAMNAPEMDAQSILTKIKPLWESDKSPWRWHAHMLAAVIEAHANENYAAARDHLAVITTAQGLPRSIQDRARALDHVYTMKMPETETPKTTPSEKEEPEG
ncbi:MAG: hypothetical protein H6867_03870 [Rhodospirillales bacterium]|nr:hypothetical protein [Rhodospirillales bacterium]MCB9996288.1 hypothetical protein [Rhodospirillales bacterium]